MDKHVHHGEENFMKRALDLATRGAGAVSPNPLVGCVVVHDGLVIGEGWHRQYGGPHAEVNALASVQDKSLLCSSTVFVTLEPCSHFGKTPPCADLLIEHRVKRVVVANVDSNPLVGGRGIKKLVAAGIDVHVGLLDEEARELNKRFFTFVEQRRPYIILKWAESSDGFIAREDYTSKWISNELSRKLVHRWRAEEDAILVGAATAKYDNPKLNVRDWSGRNPLRVVIDKDRSLEKTLNIFDGSQKTFCYNCAENVTSDNVQWIKIPSDNFLQHLSNDLYEKQIQSIIIEGGSKTIQSFIDTGLWDEARIFKSQVLFGAGVKSPHVSGPIVSSHHVLHDSLTILKNSSTK